MLFIIRNTFLINVPSTVFGCKVAARCCSCGVHHLCEMKDKSKDAPAIVICSNRNDDSAFIGATFVHLLTILKDLSMIHQAS